MRLRSEGPFSCASSHANTRCFSRESRQSISWVCERWQLPRHQMRIGQTWQSSLRTQRQARSSAARSASSRGPKPSNRCPVRKPGLYPVVAGVAVAGEVDREMVAAVAQGLDRLAHPGEARAPFREVAVEEEPRMAVAGEPHPGQLPQMLDVEIE